MLMATIEDRSNTQLSTNNTYQHLSTVVPLLLRLYWMYAVTHSLPLSRSLKMSRYTRIALHILDAPTMLKSMGDDVYEHGVVSKSRGGEIVCRPYVIYSYYITCQAVQDIGRSQCWGGKGYHIALHTKVANHQRKPNKPKKPKGHSQKHSKTIEFSKKNKKTKDLGNYGTASPDRHLS